MIDHHDQLGPAIHRAVSDICARVVQIEPGVLVTVTRVTLSTDEHTATIFVDVLPQNKRGTALRHLRAARGRIQRELVTHFVRRRLPTIEFAIESDDGTRNPDAVHPSAGSLSLDA